MPHMPKPAKLNAYGFDLKSLKLVNDDVSDKNEIVNINTQGVYNFRSSLFNIHICDLFFQTFDFDVASYANDYTPYACCDSIDEIIRSLKDREERTGGFI